MPESVDPGAESLDERTRVFVTRRHEEVSLSRVVHLSLLDELPESIVHRLPHVTPAAHRVTEIDFDGVAEHRHVGSLIPLLQPERQKWFLNLNYTK